MFIYNLENKKYKLIDLIKEKFLENKNSLYKVKVNFYIRPQINVFCTLQKVLNFKYIFNVYNFIIQLQYIQEIIRKDNT